MLCPSGSNKQHGHNLKNLVLHTVLRAEPLHFKKIQFFFIGFLLVIECAVKECNLGVYLEKASSFGQRTKVAIESSILILFEEH